VEERNQKVQSYFHLTAKQFDALYDEPNFFLKLFNKFFRAAIFQRSEKSINECLKSEAQSILDVGCGSGVNSVFFAQSGISKVVGLDYAGNMLDLARGRIPEEYIDTLEYVDSDFMLWNSEIKFDCVVALGVFDYLDQPREFLEKMMRHADKKVMFSVPGKDFARMYLRKWRYQLRGCPLYFYSKEDLAPLCSFPNSEMKFLPIKSSGFLCVIDKK
jgi:ubiquinone/menaquinone biosynthesis C-methylase UbiE